MYPTADITELLVAVSSGGRGCPQPPLTEAVELRFVERLTVADTAAVVGVAPITVTRAWALASAWLRREMRGQPA